MVESRRLGSRYTLDTLLGEGSFGQVWRGVDAAGAVWAFKLLRPQLAADPAVVRRFVEERDLLSSIRHPHVVGVQDLVVEGHTLAIVMDLVDGPDLRGQLREHQTFAPQRVAVVGAQVAAALAAAHARGVVHRDVKPENVLVRGATCWLTDFGIAWLVDGTDRSTVMLGTPHYMAPEIVQGRAPTPAADLYSLGVVLYEMSCGVPPFAGRGAAMAVLRAHTGEQPGRPPTIPDPLWDVIAALLAKDPQRRPQAMVTADRLRALAPTLAHLPAPPPMRTPPPARPTAAPLTPTRGPSPDTEPTWRPSPPVGGLPAPAPVDRQPASNRALRPAAAVRLAAAGAVGVLAGLLLFRALPFSSDDREPAAPAPQQRSADTAPPARPEGSVPGGTSAPAGPPQAAPFAPGTPPNRTPSSVVVVQGSSGPPCPGTGTASPWGAYPAAQCTLWQPATGLLTGAALGTGPTLVTCQADLRVANRVYRAGQVNTWWVWAQADSGAWDWFPQTALRQGDSGQPVNGVATCVA